ncbi:hypothetical protein GCM10025866_28520 [Naasia aerilata]|uniref:Protein translocase subunit SecF n=1 Tax=Naasia aerilata TaxID=1162966 RepID=A0ABM8GFT7_9MICO|nr:hypothetical protein GCM10025866_28520 [Naasia aerilata]
MASFSQFGNDLYTGKRSIDFIGRRRIWFLVSAIAVLLALTVPFLRGGFTFGIEFTGGSEFRITDVAGSDQTKAEDAVTSVVPDIAPRVSTVGSDGLRVQTDQLTDTQSTEVRAALADAYGLPLEDVTESFIGPSWGADITGQALRGLLIFLGLAAIAMALYFRTWKMAAAALIALLHDLVITAGVYGIVGFEVTPAAVIGFLTILGYSLYDTVVVFDKIRENTTGERARPGGPSARPSTWRSTRPWCAPSTRRWSRSCRSRRSSSSERSCSAPAPCATSRWPCSSASSSAPTRRSSSRRRCTRCCASGSRRSRSRASARSSCARRVSRRSRSPPVP